MVVSLPSSLTGVVRRREVSDYFHQRAANSSSSHSGRGRGGRGRYFEESAAGDKTLTELFHEGQVRAQNMCISKGWEKTVFRRCCAYGLRRRSMLLDVVFSETQRS